MALLDTLGWLADLVAQHLYRDDVPQSQRRRWSLDGDGWTVVDDTMNEILRVSLAEAGSGAAGVVPPPTEAGSVLQSLDGTTIEWADELTLGAAPATTGEIRMSTTSGIHTRISGVNRRIADASGAIRIGDAGMNLQAFGEQALFTLGATGTFAVDIDGEQEIFESPAQTIRRMGSDLFSEIVVWDEALAATGNIDVVSYNPSISDGVILAIADFASLEGTPHYHGARVVRTFSVSSNVVATAGATTTLHSAGTSAIIVPDLIVTGGNSITARAAAGVLTVDVAAKLTLVQFKS